MKVGVYYSNEDIRVEEIDKPFIGAGEILVKVKASGICGSDLLEWYRIDRVPMVLGHEVSGDVVEVGEGVEKFRPGDRICVAHHVPCGQCHYCINGHHTVCDKLLHTNFDPGGFSEFIRLPSINVERGAFPLFDNVGYEEATFVEPLACILRAQGKIKDIAGKTLLVMGTGIAGLLHIQVARLLGAGRIIATDRNSFRLEKARELGADVTLLADGGIIPAEHDILFEHGENLSMDSDMPSTGRVSLLADKGNTSPDRQSLSASGMPRSSCKCGIPSERDIPALIRECNEGRLADIVILCTGALDAVNQALRSIDRGGVLVFFAVTDKGVSLSIDPNKLFWRTEITLTSSYAGSQEDYARALELLHLGKVRVKDLITHIYSLDEIGEAFRTLLGTRDSLKVIIRP